MEKLFQLLFTPEANALGWTLIHATWQIMLLALAYLAVKLITRNSETRYWTGMGLLIFQLLASGATFAFLLNQKTKILHWSDFVLGEGSLSFSERMVQSINQNIYLISGLWLAGISLLMFKLILNYLNANSLKNSQLNTSSDRLNAILGRIKTELGINQEVRILETSAASVPMIIGTLRPVILLPITLASGLSSRQIELIIAHELAHLKRYDNAFNIGQSFIEILFFFHPGIWFLSSEIRQEREHCCDNVALKVIDDRLLLAQTLAYIQEVTPRYTLAMAFGRKRMSLLERIRHILGVNQRNSHTKESLWLLGGLVVIFLSISQIQAKQKEENQKVNDDFLNDDNSLTVSETFSAKRDTLIKNNFQMSNEKYRVEIYDDKILINGKEQPLTTEQQATLRKNYAALRNADARMQPQLKVLEQKAEQLSQYAAQIEIDQRPMEEISEKMAAVSEKMERISKKYESQFLDENKSPNELKAISQKMQAEMDSYQKQMEDYEKEMEKVQRSYENGVTKQMEGVQKELETYQQPIEEIGSEMEGYMDEIKTLLPSNVRKEFEKMPHALPPPPPPPISPVAPNPRNTGDIPPPPKSPRRGSLKLETRPLFYLPLSPKNANGNNC